MRAHKLRSISIGISTLFLAACATAPSSPPSPLAQLKEAFASDDPCSNKSRNIGMLAGSLGGILLGNTLGNGKDESSLAGAAFGALVGGFIGADMDRKRCELSKVAKKYDLDIVFTDIRGGETMASTTPSATLASAAPAKTPAAPQAANSPVEELIGNSVNVRDKEGATGHFDSGSDKLTPKATEYFAAIATQYAPATVLGAISNAKQKDEITNQLAKRHMLIIGHTDDTGSSQLNAYLSERRARAVAAFMRSKGVPESSLFYEGAGETLPIADNRTESGRAQNRRVEIVEINNAASFQKYLENRKPQYAFYRPRESPSNDSHKAAQTDTAAPTRVKTMPVQPGKKVPGTSMAKIEPAKPGTATSTTPGSTSAKANANTPQAAKPSAIPSGDDLDFGGVPYTANGARINSGMLVPEKTFGLISSANAAVAALTADCTYDRPRNAGQVKALQGDSPYKTTEFLPQLYGKTWAAEINGNLLVINRLSVLRNGAAPANLPELKVYKQTPPPPGRKADIVVEPQVNSYRVDKGVLYRMFPTNAHGVQCMDILFALDGSTTSRAGKLIYTKANERYLADVKLEIQ